MPPTPYAAAQPYKRRKPQKAPLSQKGGWRDYPGAAITNRRRPLPSFRRRPESRTPVSPAFQMAGVWIPAFAGMTDDVVRRLWRWLPYSVGAHGRAPLPRITIPG